MGGSSSQISRESWSLWWKHESSPSPSRTSPFKWNFLLLRAIIPAIGLPPLGLDCVLLLDERFIFVVAHMTALASAPVGHVVLPVCVVMILFDASVEVIPGLEDISRVLGQHFGRDVVEATRAAAPVPDAAVKRSEMST